MRTPEFYEERNLEHDLIIHLCRKAKGIGEDERSALIGEDEA